MDDTLLGRVLHQILGVTADRQVTWLVSLGYLVVVAFLVGRWAPQRRRFLRIALTFQALYVACTAVGYLLAHGGLASWSQGTYAVADFFCHALFINLTGIVVFFLALPATRLTVPDIARDLVVATAYAVSILGLLHRLGFEVWSLLATSAVASLVVGVSIQPTLANVFGGVALQIDGSIHPGDWVRLPDKLEGKVREIRWRHTVLETRNGDTLVVPNAELLKENILVLGRREGERLQHRLWAYFHVELSTAPEQVIEVVNQALANCEIEGVSNKPAPDCILLALTSPTLPSAAQYAVRFWLTDLARDDPTNSRVMLRIHTALQRANIPLAVPSQAVTVSKRGTKRAQATEQQEIDRRAELLSRVELFRSMKLDELRALAPRMRPTPFSPGEIVTRQGAEAHWLYILVAGEANITARLPDGRLKHLADIQAPNIFGEFGLLTGSPRMATVTAKSAIECFRLDKEAFRQVISSRPDIAREVAEILAERQHRFEQSRLEPGDPPAERDEFSAHLILDQVRRFFGVDDESPTSKA
jgi:small-conductance mechanosensitive channel/CRP-like cAMP-binding protein